MHSGNPLPSYMTGTVTSGRWVKRGTDKVLVTALLYVNPTFFTCHPESFGEPQAAYRAYVVMQAYVKVILMMAFPYYSMSSELFVKVPSCSSSTFL